jgi:type IV pilus assembly protein PilO
MNQIRRYLTLLNLHIAGVVVLAGVMLFYAIKAAIAFHETGATESAAYQQQQIQYAQLKAEMAHIQGLPQKVDQSRDDAQHFFEKRIAPNYSAIAEELGTLTVKNQVRLSRAQYGGAPAIDGLTELRIDANLTGDYAGMMHFINDLERDKNHVFFLINDVTFTGQQGGLVNLRLRMTTWISASATDIPQSSDASATQPASAQPVSQEVQ